jgi:hypothetical protein
MANVKNAPEATYFVRYGYSQVYPYVLVRKSDSGKTAYLKPVRTIGDPEWTPHILPGGFCGHCDNQSEQTWLYDGVEDREIAIRKNRRGEWSRMGERFAEDKNGPYYFYDYNF